ncbi:hypothetical protein HYFRA_00008619 [Hymenoscyphus fraxineus]|uniref:Uncharacterized protein n=1 Tax=Hymenoscyphus fraxineus TaxID=746836 RepID=A0A9N9KXL4_9HELO|nr:hypothetical protein HYFRA_00008619 [Hymenoscyphus fraxineus]
MPTTLLSIPMEIRHKIFAELLSINNNTSCHDDGQEFRAEGRKEWHIENNHPLLYVNKQIREEALVSFHHENELISLEADYFAYQHRVLFEEQLPLVVPIQRREERDRNAALHIDLQLHQGRPRGRAAGTDWGTDTQFDRNGNRIIEKKYAVMAGRHLPRLIAAINAKWSYTRNHTFDYALPIPLITIVFEFNTTGKYYGEHVPRRARRLADLAKGLRQCHFAYLYDQIVPFGYSPPKIDISSREIIVRGLDDEKSKELIESSNLPPMTPNECIQEARKLQDKGDLLASQGFYMDALSTYRLSIFVMTGDHFPEVPRNKLRRFYTLETVSILTGACWGAWKMSRKLNLTKVECEYFYGLLHTTYHFLRNPQGHTLEECNEFLDRYSSDFLQNDQLSLLWGCYDAAHKAHPEVGKFWTLFQRVQVLQEPAKYNLSEVIIELKNTFFEIN